MPQTPADEIAAPLLQQLDDLSSRMFTAAQIEIDSMKKEIQRQARLQVARTKQLEFKDRALKDARNEIDVLQAKIKRLEDENESLKLMVN